MLMMIWTVLLSPLAAFVVILCLPRRFRILAPAAGIAAALASLCTCGLFFLPDALKHLTEQGTCYVARWMDISDIALRGLPGLPAPVLQDIFFGLMLDPLNLAMITVIACVNFFVQLFSFTFMRRTDGCSRYFAFLSLLSFSMTGLVLSSNLLESFMFWELTGLAAYLLAGFRPEEPTAAGAGRKAFVINRTAGLGFLAGLALLFLGLGHLSLIDLCGPQALANLPAWFLTTTGLCLFLGIMGRSALMPLHVWLTEASEGPAPTAALMHSTVPAAAGIFLLVRLFPIFSASPTVLFFALAAGAVTSVCAAVLACVQPDIRRALSYAAISQLGLMVMAAGAGAPVFGFFHLITYALFMALLFLAAGILTQRHGTADMVQIAQKGVFKQSFVLFFFLFGLVSLAGIPPFGGFFSKDAILHSLSTQHPVFSVAGFVITLLTAFYSFRLFFGLTAGQSPDRESSEPGFTKIISRFALFSLALLSLLSGFAGTPLFGEKLLSWLAPHTHGIPMNPLRWGINSILIACGAAAAYIIVRIGLNRSSPMPSSPGVLQQKLSCNALYAFAINEIGFRLAAACGHLERLISNRFVGGPAWGLFRLGGLFCKLQNGLLQHYLLVVVVVLFTVTVFFLTAGGILR